VKPLLAVCPSFPSPTLARDGQSIYVVEAARALARLRGEPLEVLSLRIGDEPPEEQGDFFRVRRLEPARPVPHVLQLYAGGVFVPVFQAFAHALVARCAAQREAPVLWAHGYELGPALERARQQGVRGVGVVHYLVADESEATLAGHDDPLRRANLHPLVGAVARTTPRRARRLAVQAAGRLAPLALHAPVLPTLLRSQFEKLSAERRFFAAAAQVVSVGRHFARTLERHYPDVRGRLSWCHAGAPGLQAPSPAHPAGTLRLVLVGRPTPQKGWDIFLEALRVLEQEHPLEAARVTLDVVGGVPPPEGTHRGYLAQVAQGLAGLRRVKVTDHGALPRERVLEVLRRSDVLAFPSVYEPFGLVMLEALSEGVGLLTSDADGPSDVVTHRVGRRVPFGDAPRRVPGLVSALRELLAQDERQRAELREAARAHATGFTWEACARVHAEALSRAAEAAVQS
jgi:glycosyltransferase involved in cell wall biosynthesis